MLRHIVTYKKLYIISDLLASAIVWTLFYMYRRLFIEFHVFGYTSPLDFGVKFFVDIVCVSILWLVIYYFSGYYNFVLRKTRLDDFINTLITTFIGCVIIFLFVIINDVIVTYRTYYRLILVLFGLQFSLVFVIRFIITSYLINQKINGNIRFRTLFIGRVEMIASVWKELNAKYVGNGHYVIGYLPVNNPESVSIADFPNVGSIESLKNVIDSYNVEDVIITLNESDATIFKYIMKSLSQCSVNVNVNPELYPLVKGVVNISSLYQYPLIQINKYLLSPFQAGLKKALDISLSLVGLLLTFPICVVLAILIKLTSKGPVFYSHERIGIAERPFRLYKFRSMFYGAENNGPQLSSKTDPRITSVGKFMRKTRLDEIPNLVNVLIGDMSLVGPRPERRFYIDKILEQAPEYKQLLKVKPGVTSLGQVKFGYAENVNEMINRMRYDLLYIENASIYVDIQILARTVIIIFQRKGV